MKRFVTALLAAAVAGALFVASPLIAAPKDTNHNNSTDQPGDCSGGTDNSLTLRAPEKLWPPNHKYFEDIHVLADSGDASGEETILLTTTGWHNQYEGDTEMNGSGNTGDDMTSDDEQASLSTGSSEEGYPQVIAVESNYDTASPGPGSSQTVQTDWKARAERSGRDQNGRIYTLNAQVDFGDGGSCNGTVTFTVPHDMRPTRR